MISVKQSRGVSRGCSARATCASVFFLAFKRLYLFELIMTIVLLLTFRDLTIIFVAYFGNLGYFIHFIAWGFILQSPVSLR